MGVELLLIVLLVAALLVGLRLRSPARGRHRIRVDGVWRSYSIERTPNTRKTGAPSIVLCFHGGLGRVDRLRRDSGITEAALRRGIAVVFPEAPDGWIDARPERGGGRRDLDFVVALLARLRRTEGEGTRFFALGVSNGGMFAQRIAMEEPRLFVAYAALLASIPAAALTQRIPGPPVPITLMFGEEDRVMPFAGGRILSRPGLGVGGMVISAEATLQYWLRRNRAMSEASVRRLGGEGEPVEVRDYAATATGAPVQFVAIEGWGHQWPRWPDEGSGGFDIGDVIFDFFARCSPAEPVADVEPVRIRLGGKR